MPGPPPMPPPPAPPCPPYIISGKAYHNGSAQAGVTVTVDNKTTSGTPYTVSSAADGSFVVNLCNISAWNDGDTIHINFSYDGDTGLKILTVDVATYPVGEDIGVFLFGVDIRKRETVSIYESHFVRAIKAGTHTVSGTAYHVASPAERMPGATVSLYRLSPAPRGNLTNYVGQTDGNGEFTFNGVENGEYVVTAQKHGYTLAWGKITVAGADESITLNLTPLEMVKLEEGVYNQWGQIYKLYQYADYEVGDWRYTESLLLLGDIYNSAAEVTAIPAIGYLEPVSRDTTIELLSMTHLGTLGFFESSEQLSYANNRISFNSTIGRRDFDGLAFKLKFSKEIDGKVQLYLNGRVWYTGTTYNTPSYSSGSVSGTAVDSDGNVIDGATIVIYEKDTDIEVGRATTDSDGHYHIPGLSPETEYDVYITKPGYGSEKGTVTTPGEGGTWEGGGGSPGYPDLWYFFTIIFIFPRLTPQTHRIYGKVYNRHKGLAYGIGYALVTAIDEATGDEYVGLSDANGDYEVYLPAATFDVYARKRRHHFPLLQRGVVSADWNVNIGISPIKKVPQYDRIGGRVIAR